VSADEFRGHRAYVRAKLPLWKAKSVVKDIERVLEHITSLPREAQPMYPLTLHDLKTDLADALKEAEAE
jgi:septation ring formation regulator EzrA